jgi:alginate O-acetyltransferase complex protein AlgI
MDAATLVDSSGFSLLSATFLAFAVVAVAADRLAVGRSAARVAVTLLLNLGFLLIVVEDWRALAAILLFVHAAYGFVLLNRSGMRWAKAGALAGVLAFWVTMFVIKNPTVFSPISLSFTIVGVSYLSFRAISAIMDAPDLDGADYLSFLAYMLFFPTVLAGPIERYERHREFLFRPEPVTADDALAALRRIVVGFVKKFVLADNLVPLGVFAFGAEATSLPVPVLWLAIIAQLLLIFLDFSGYSDIMIGIARLMGYRLQENFDRPYFARNLQEFWDRWHMSLTFFVRDFVFTPICKFIFWRVERKHQFPFVLATYFFTMLVIAMWHKVSWGFLMFGLMHGTALSLLQLKRRYVDSARWGKSAAVSMLLRPPAPAAMALTWTFFALSTVSWFFPPHVTAAIFARAFGLST